MPIAFCTTCKGRVQHIEQTLPVNLKDNEQNFARFILLDYGSPDNLQTYLVTNHREEIEAGRLIVYSFQEPGPFRMAHAKNMAHRLAMLEGADVLVNLDADNFTGPDFGSYIARHFDARDDIFMWAKMVKHGPDRLARGISGRIAVTAHAFMKAGGYDEQYNTWSPDDKDFNARLRRLGYKGQEIDRRYLHAVLHTDKMRFKEYREAETAYEQFETVNDSEATVVNYGNIGTGTVFRNYGTDPVVIDRLPTRIFGIGMHKTATTSLHTALKILGLDSGHWKSAHWAKAIWEEMTTWGRSWTLEQNYALCDLPITILYKELDRAYPGSKFILTTRDERRWIDSVRKHWSHDHNKFRADWSHDPFTHKVHKLLYGQKGFEPELFLARYRRHNDEVRQYFKGRPDDLLVMEMDKGAGWPALCGFLKQPAPAVPYPRAFATAERGRGVQ
jgi:hypothetical protein